MHYDMAGNIDRWGSKYENLIFPVIILAFSLFWHLFISYFEKKADRAATAKEAAEAASNAKVMKIAGVSMAAVFTILQGSILLGAYKQAISGDAARTADIGRVSVILMGALMLVLGNYMTKTRINGIVGVRVVWSMYNDNTWRKTNRFGAVALIIAGLLTIILGVVLKTAFGAMMTMLGLIALTTLITLIYAHRIYVKERGSEKGEK